MGPSLKGRALRLLSNREHSRHELAQKLKSHAQSEEELAQTLESVSYTHLTLPTNREV